MSTVEEFADDIRTSPVRGGNDVDLSGPLAHHLTKLGYRRPRQVATVEDLKALRLPAIIDSPAGGPARVEYYAGPGRQQRYVEPLFCDDDSDTECYSPEFFATFGLPATVLLEAAS